MKQFKKTLSVLLACALTLTFDGVSNVASAAKAPKISKKTITLTVGQSKKVTIKNRPGKSKVTWKTANKKIATVKNGKIKGVKKGNTKVTATLTYKKSGKNTSKKFTVKVTVKAKATSKATTTPTSTPASGGAATATTAPAQTPAPAQPTAPAATDIPSQSTAPVANINPNGTLKDTCIGEEHQSKNGITTTDNGVMRTNLSSQDLMEVMGLGWNLGNTMEESNYLGKNTTVKECEQNAGNPVTTAKIFRKLKQNYGINTVRVPVAWSNLMSTDGTYTINEDYFNRVEEIINYVLASDMYVIINIHWDGGWWGMFGDKDTAVREEALKKYTAFWQQISARYQEYSDHLIFEGANEEFGERLNDDWNKHSNTQTGVLTKEEYEAKTLELNQLFVDIVRGSGGNNTYRHLLIPGLNTNTDYTCSDAFKMPQDIAENGVSKLSVSIHYYDPTPWGISETVTDWDYVGSWGIDDPDTPDVDEKQRDYDYLTQQMDKIHDTFAAKGYGVILGECGIVSMNKDGVPDYLKELFTQCLAKQICPVMWDNGGLFDRKECYFKYVDVGDVFNALTNTTAEYPEGAAMMYTGKPQPLTSENQSPKVVATWEGDFMRHSNENNVSIIQALRGDEYVKENGNYASMWRTDSVTPNLKPTCSELQWHMHFELIDPETGDYVWKDLEKPAVRITMNDDMYSQTADLQLTYCDHYGENDKDMGSWMFESDLAQVMGTDEDGNPERDEDGNILLADTAWQGKVLNLNSKYLEKYPVLILTTHTYTGASFVKVEICDAAYNEDGTPFENSTEE